MSRKYFLQFYLLLGLFAIYFYRKWDIYATNTFFTCLFEFPRNWDRGYVENSKWIYCSTLNLVTNIWEGYLLLFHYFKNTFSTCITLAIYYSLETIFIYKYLLIRREQIAYSLVFIHTLSSVYDRRTMAGSHFSEILVTSLIGEQLFRSITFFFEISLHRT